ncbi:hypothetical protein Tco_1171437 [Tanacetum coccineum]
MKRASKGYTGVDTPLFQTVLVQGQILQGEGSTIETEVPQPSSPSQTHVAYEAASISVDVRQGGAATTVSSLDAGQGSGNIDKTSVIPHDSPLPSVYTLGSDEGRMQTNELMELVTKLSDRVKTLEKTIKSSKARRRDQFVVSDDKEEDSFNQGREIAEIDEDPDISLFTTPKEVYTTEPNISTANVLVSTAGVEVSTTAESLVYIRRSAVKRKEKGKAIMKESEPTQTKTKIQQEQERLGFEEAQRLQEQFDEEERQRIASVHEEAMKRVNTFTLMESDDTVPKVVAGSSKRSVEEELGKESSKSQNIGEGSESAKESKEKESDELSQEQLQQLIIIVPEEVGNHTEVYKIFEDMLKNFDRDDLVRLWSLVHERFNSTEPTKEKERELWVELKRLFKPVDDDELWKS